MATLLTKGWWVLNLSLIISFILAYFILFVPNNIFSRPEYFTHAYIAILLSVIIYAVFYFLFIEIDSKVSIERDKILLSTRVRSLSEETAKINTIAYKDYLTGIQNRHALYRKLDFYIESKQQFDLIFIDLENLKYINDNFNHKTGDSYLKAFANALQTAILECGEVFRFAGDEFVCIIPNKESNFDCAKLKEDVNKYIKVDVPYLGMSLGLVSYPKDASNADDLIHMADQKMYNEKNAKKHI
jgi:diguanylate cyclase (GGDEF)-like protein